MKKNSFERAIFLIFQKDWSKSDLYEYLPEDSSRKNFVSNTRSFN